MAHASPVAGQAPPSPGTDRCRRPRLGGRAASRLRRRQRRDPLPCGRRCPPRRASRARRLDHAAPPGRALGERREPASVRRHQGGSRARPRGGGPPHRRGPAAARPARRAAADGGRQARRLPAAAPWSVRSPRGALLSLGIELLQTGVPGQVVDVDSLLLNTVGVALAHARRGARRPGRAPPPGGDGAVRAALRREERGSGSDPDDSQGRDRPVERRFARFVSVALKHR